METIESRTCSVENTSTSPLSPKMMAFEEHVKAYEKDGQQEGKPSSSAVFVLDAMQLEPSRFYCSPVWNGVGNAADGLLGCQAPAADGLEQDTFTLYHEPSQHQAAARPVSLPKSPAARTLPPFPTEIHLQIITQVLESSENKSCEFCRLFELSTLSRVSRLYYMLLQPFLYDTVDLNFNSSINCKESLTHSADDRRACSEHLRLASKRHQLELRVPLLVRTLVSRPDIASTVRRLMLPAGGTQTYLTCALEKTLLPDLIRSCPNLEVVDGVDCLLARQFFSGEHYCFDGLEPQQHGELARALHQMQTLRRWSWNGGNAGGCDFWSRLWDRNPKMQGVGFVAAHRHWGMLEQLEIRDVWNVDATMVRDVIAQLPMLRKVALVGPRKKRAGRGDAETMLAALEALPASVTAVEIGNAADEAFLPAVGEWVRCRDHMLEALHITRVPVAADSLRRFLAALTVREASTSRFYIPLLDFATHLCSAVKRLHIDNAGFEDMFDAAEWMELPMLLDPSCMELQGLEELEWRVRSADGACSLAAGLRRGWFRDIHTMAGPLDEDTVCATEERGVRIGQCIPQSLGRHL